MGMREFQARQLALKAINNANNTEQKQVALAQHGNDYAVLEIALRNDVNAIRALPTLEMRAEQKQRFLNKWLPYVYEYLRAEKVYQNDYFVFCIIYLFDIGDFEQALALSKTAIQQGQSMPEPFKSNLPTFVADQVYQWADKTAAAGYAVEPYFSQTLQNVATQWQLHEIIVAKWLKLAAALLLRNEKGKVHAASQDDPENLIFAINLCVRAFQLNHKAGVKNMIERCFMRLAALEKTGQYQADKFPPVASLSEDKAEINFDAIINKLCARPPSEGEEHV